MKNSQYLAANQEWSIAQGRKTDPKPGEKTIETDFKRSEMMEVEDKSIKTATWNVLKVFKKTDEK